jgi:hypothetical protein
MDVVWWFRSKSVLRCDGCCIAALMYNAKHPGEFRPQPELVAHSPEASGIRNLDGVLSKFRNVHHCSWVYHGQYNMVFVPSRTGSWPLHGDGRPGKSPLRTPVRPIFSNLSGFPKVVRFSSDFKINFKFLSSQAQPYQTGTTGHGYLIFISKINGPSGGQLCILQ